MHVRSKLGYMAPEVWKCRAFDGRLADVFSLGVVLYGMLFVGHKPFAVANTDDVAYRLISTGRIREYLVRSGTRGVVSESALDLLSHMLCPEERRISLDTVLQHNFLQPLLLELARRQLQHAGNSMSASPTPLRPVSVSDVLMQRVAQSLAAAAAATGSVRKWKVIGQAGGGGVHQGSGGGGGGVVAQTKLQLQAHHAELDGQQQQQLQQQQQHCVCSCGCPFKI